MFEQSNQPTFTNAKQAMEYHKEQEKIKEEKQRRIARQMAIEAQQKAEQEAIKAREKAEKEAFQNTQINLAKESNKTAKAALIISVVAIIISVITNIVQIIIK